MLPHFDIPTPRLESVLLVAAETVGITAGEGDGVLHAEVRNRLGEIVERLLVETAHRHDLAVQLAQGVAQCLVLGLVLHHRAVAHQRILTEEIAVFAGRLLKQRGTLRHPEPDFPVENRAESLFGYSA